MAHADIDILIRTLSDPYRDDALMHEIEFVARGRAIESFHAQFPMYANAIVGSTRISFRVAPPHVGAGHITHECFFTYRVEYSRGAVFVGPTGELPSPEYLPSIAASPEPVRVFNDARTGFRVEIENIQRKEGGRFPLLRFVKPMGSSYDLGVGIQLVDALNLADLIEQAKQELLSRVSREELLAVYHTHGMDPACSWLYEQIGLDRDRAWVFIQSLIKPKGQVIEDPANDFKID